MHEDWDEPEGDITPIACEVRYDGSVAVLLDVPGELEPIEAIFAGNAYTVLMTWDAARPIDLHGTRADERRVQEIVARGVSRLNREWQRERERRRQRSVSVDCD